MKQKHVLLCEHDLFELAEIIYFDVVEVLELTDKCIEPYGNGTRNTEHGESLYLTIESNLLHYYENLQA